MITTTGFIIMPCAIDPFGFAHLVCIRKSGQESSLTPLNWIHILLLRSLILIPYHQGQLRWEQETPTLPSKRKKKTILLDATQFFFCPLINNMEPSGFGYFCCLMWWGVSSVVGIYQPRFSLFEQFVNVMPVCYKRAHFRDWVDVCALASCLHHQVNGSSSGGGGGRGDEQERESQQYKENQ